MSDDARTMPGRHECSDQLPGSAEIVVLLRNRAARAADEAIDVARGEQLLGMLRELARRGRMTDTSG